MILIIEFSGDYRPVTHYRARSWLSISGGGVGGGGTAERMILTFVLAASFPFQLRKIGIELNILLHCKSIILVLNFVSL